MNKRLKIKISTKLWLYILTGACVCLIGITFFTSVMSRPIQKFNSYIVVPLQDGVNGIGLWLTEKSDNLKTIKELTNENDELQAKVDALTQENLALQEGQIDLQNLRKLYDLDNTYDQYKKVGARVIARDSSNWYSTFTINKGSKDGLEVDMNVIAGNGLVGIITEVGDNYAIVRSIIDDSSKVSAMLLKSSDLCTVSGDLKLMDDGYINMEYLDSKVDISNGDIIVTSNISNKYVEGLLIGYAYNIKTDSNNLTKSGYIVPAVDFAHINQVLVILDKKTIKR